jgi:electron transfer flavoprotein alpha subunit
MPPITTVDDVMQLARGLSPLEKLKLIERLAPELEGALASAQAAAPDLSLDDQYAQGYTQTPEVIADVEGLLPHLGSVSEQWE